MLNRKQRTHLAPLSANEWRRSIFHLFFLCFSFPHVFSIFVLSFSFVVPDMREPRCRRHRCRHTKGAAWENITVYHCECERVTRITWNSTTHRKIHWLNGKTLETNAACTLIDSCYTYTHTLRMFKILVMYTCIDTGTHTHTNAPHRESWTHEYHLVCNVQ